MFLKSPPRKDPCSTMPKIDLPKVAALEERFRQQLLATLPKIDWGILFGCQFWGSSARLIEVGTARALVGIRPVGGQEDAAYNRDHGGLDKPYTAPRWNAFLDELPPGHSPYQESIRALFEALYGEDDGEETLRRTACLNVCPFYTASASPRHLPPDLWAMSAEWCVEILEALQPKLELIICLGNGEPSSRAWPPRARSSTRSPWAVLGARFGLETLDQVPIGSNFSLKEGLLKTGSLAGTRVLGLPLRVLGPRRDLLPHLLDQVRRIGRAQRFP